MLDSDLKLFIDFIKKDEPVEIVEHLGDSNIVKPLDIEKIKGGFLTLWNHRLQPTLERKLIPNAVHEPYRIDESSLSVLEFSPSIVTSWNGNDALIQGRIYGILEGKSPELLKWFNKIARWIRKNAIKNLLPPSYVAAEAYELFKRGGILLPMFLPPVNDEWRDYFVRQREAIK